MTNCLRIFIQIDTTGTYRTSTFSPVLIHSLWAAAALVLIVTIVYYFFSERKLEHSSVYREKTGESAKKELKQVEEVNSTTSVKEKPEVIEQVTTKKNEIASKPEKPEPKKVIVEKATIQEDKKQEIFKATESTPPGQKVATAVIEIKETEIIAEKEEQSSAKYIGYNPINIFEQSEPYNYPYVIMPKAGCVIKFPRKGKVGRKGYTEEAFLQKVRESFSSTFQIFDDRFIIVKGSEKPFEPDIALVEEKNGINLFIDIEIDEPYEGTNDINSRKATHFQGVDINRNNAFKSRGWIVIRFAEIQVYQQPDSCILFIADVVKSIYPQFAIPTSIQCTREIKPVPQWTKEQAEQWSREKYRERYLGIPQFGIVAESEQLLGIKETDLGQEIEKEVKEEIAIARPVTSTTVSSSSSPLFEMIRAAKESGHYISFSYEGKITIVKPFHLVQNVLTAHCYVKNEDKQFELVKLSNCIVKDKPFVVEAKRPSLGIERIRDIVNTAIRYNKYIRMRYTRRAWSDLHWDNEAGEFVLRDLRDAEESMRTINNVRLSVNVLGHDEVRRYNFNQNYITAYCNKREEQRTFKFDRISEIAILNI